MKTIDRNGWTPDRDPNLRAVTVCEGEICERIEFGTNDELAAYAQGFTDGARNYGAGSAGVYTLDDLAAGEVSEDIRGKVAEALA